MSGRNSSGRSRSKSPGRQSGQPAIFTPSSGSSALYGGPSPTSPSSLNQQLSPGSMTFINQFFAGADQSGLNNEAFLRQSVLAQPATFQPSSSLSLSGRRRQQNAVQVLPTQSSCIVSPNLSPGTVNMMENFFAAADQAGFQQVGCSSSQSPRRNSPVLL